MKKYSLVLIAVLLIAISGAANAVNSISWFATLNGSSTAITSAEIGGIGSTLLLDIWYSSDATLSSVTSMFTWDSATSKGVAATKLDNILSGALATGMDTSVWTGGSLNKNDRGGAYAVSGTRGYGNYVALSKAAGSGSVGPTAGTKLFTVELTNLALNEGDSKIASLVSVNTTVNTLGWNSYGVLASGGTKIFSSPANYDITISRPNSQPPSVPEPSSIIALGSGALGLLGFLRRRRS